MTARIAILDDYQRVAESMADWASLGEDVEVTFFHDHLADPDQLVARLTPIDIIGIMRERTPFPASLLERLPNLRLLITTGRRNASIDLAAAQRLGVTVCGTGAPGHATAELAMALMLTLARKLPTETASMRQGGWQVGLGRDLHGATLGLVGLGRLGSRVARTAQAFEMKVIAWSENLTDERATEHGVRRVTKADLLKSADFVSVHLQLSPRTRGLIGAAELALMKPEAYLINTSRGPIVDQDALVDALRANRIAGAALDVFDHEPLPPDDPLREVPNLLLTPHIGYVTRETYAVFYREMVEGIAAFLAGRPLRVIVPK
ncbi:MAG: D-2-hydroxyacid dehydrogenase family protein [Pseudomonadota bacterium]